MPKAQDKPLKMDDERVLLAIDLAFAGRHTNAVIAQKCSISPRTYAYWLKHPDFQAALEAKRADFKQSIERVTFADKARRIHALNDAARLALDELEERPLLKEVRPTKDGFITNEAFNNTAMAEFRSALADIAAELGERKHVTELTGKDGGPIELSDVHSKLFARAAAIRERRRPAGDAGDAHAQ